MSCYDLGKLMSEARRLAADYHRATGQTLPLSNEIARYDAMQLLQLEAPKEEIAGVDAVGTGVRAGHNVQIKGRVVFDGNKSKQRIGQLGLDGKWHSVVLVLMNSDYEPVELIEAGREALVNALNQIAPNKRGAMTVSRFRMLGEVVWRASIAA